MAFRKTYHKATQPNFKLSHCRRFRWLIVRGWTARLFEDLLGYDFESRANCLLG